MNRLCSLVLCASLIALSGCANQDVQSGNTSYVSTEALKEYRTYAWSSNRNLSLRDPSRNTATARGWIESAVDQELTGKGLSKSNSGSADLLVGYAVGSRNVSHYDEYAAASEVTGKRVDIQGGTGPLWDMARERDTGFEQGRLFIEITDRKTGKTVYKGSAAANLLDNQSASQSPARINRGVKGALKNFPTR